MPVSSTMTVTKTLGSFVPTPQSTRVRPPTSAQPNKGPSTESTEVRVTSAGFVPSSLRHSARVWNLNPHRPVRGRGWAKQRISAYLFWHIGAS